MPFWGALGGLLDLLVSPSPPAGSEELGARILHSSFQLLKPFNFTSFFSSLLCSLLCLSFLLLRALKSPLRRLLEHPKRPKKHPDSSHSCFFQVELFRSKMVPRRIQERFKSLQERLGRPKSSPRVVQKLAQGGCSAGPVGL